MIQGHAERFKFHGRFRKPDEIVAVFVAELRRLAEHCNFGATLETMIRDRLVCGINDEHVLKRLLAESDVADGRSMQKRRDVKSSCSAQEKDLTFTRYSRAQALGRLLAFVAAELGTSKLRPGKGRCCVLSVWK